MSNTSMFLHRHAKSLSFVIAAAALFIALGDRGLNEPDEGRYASTAAHMVLSGDWLVPHFQGEVHLTKPPLVYWLMAGAFRVFGFTEWAARLPSALAALVTVMLTFSIAADRYGRIAGLYAAVLLVFSPLFFILSRVADPNMLLTMWITLAFWAWLRWRDRGLTRYLLVFYAALGGSFMTKGPVGPLLALIALAGYAYHMRDLRGLRESWSWAGVGLFLLISLPWFVLLMARDHTLVRYFLHDELYNRVFTNQHGRSEPIWFYWVVLPLGFLPWITLLASGLRRALKRGGDMTADGKAWLTIVAAIMVFFTLCRSKLPTYILPALPLVTLFAVAHLFSLPESRRERLERLAVGSATITAAALPLLFLVIGIVKYHWPMSYIAAAVLYQQLVLFYLLAIMLDYPFVLKVSTVMALAYTALLGIVTVHENVLSHTSAEAELVHNLQESYRKEALPIVYMKAPAALEFYLQTVPEIVSVDELCHLSPGNRWDLTDKIAYAQDHGPEDFYLIISRDKYESYKWGFLHDLDIVAKDGEYVVFRLNRLSHHLPDTHHFGARPSRVSAMRVRAAGAPA